MVVAYDGQDGYISELMTCCIPTAQQDSIRSIDFINIVNEFTEKKICLHFKDKNIVTLDDDGTENVLTSLYLYIGYVCPA